MTENEAIRIAIHCMKIEMKEGTCEGCLLYRKNWKDCIETKKTAISALEEFQQYREIGTVEECREAMEKQIPRKPRDVEYDHSYFVCGNCGTAIYTSDEFEAHRYCLNCGQAVQWENLEGMEDE